MRKIPLLLFVVCVSTAQGLSFTRHAPVGRTLPPVRNHVCETVLSASKKEEEIAALEEKLRLLKAETEEEESLGTPLDEDDEKSSEGEGWAIKPGKETMMAEMMSEQWKETETQNDGGVFPKAIGAIAFLAFLAFFSQAPVGQDDLQKYSGGITGATTSKVDFGDLNPRSDQ